MDLLVNLYDVRSDPELERRIGAQQVVVRRALAPELAIVRDWIARRFRPGWDSEAQVAMGRQPSACFIAVRDRELLGFACYDAIALGMFGPTGVDEGARGLGVGKSLLIRTLVAMRDQGYAYGVIGGAGPVEYYVRAVGAIPIVGSEESIYSGILVPLVPGSDR